MTPFSYQIYQSAISAKLIETGDKLIVSISGGADSVCLLLVLLEFKEKLDLELRLAHFHHGIRPESDKEEEFLRSLASLHKLPLEVIRTDLLQNSKGIQFNARRWRYANLDRLLLANNYTKIALAHHLNDLLETQLWRMIRGGSLFSLSPILEQNGSYIRPLLRTKKEDMYSFLQAKGQTWCEDSSNNENKYTRNRIRNQIIPLMQKLAGDRLEEKFLGLYDDSLNLRAEFYQKVPLNHYEQEILPYETIRSTDNLFRLELIHQYLLFNQVDEINRENLNRVLRLVLANQGNWQISLKQGKILKGKNRSLNIETKQI
jgi:tRNA(Ile)-lysidine synthetase-like protein